MVSVWNFDRNSASYIVDLSEYRFHDEVWMKNRDKNYNRPLNIYEVHLGSWRTNEKDENGWYRYHEIADKLIAHAKENGYTHLGNFFRSANIRQTVHGGIRIQDISVLHHVMELQEI